MYNLKNRKYKNKQNRLSKMKNLNEYKYTTTNEVSFTANAFECNYAFAKTKTKNKK